MMRHFSTLLFLTALFSPGLHAGDGFVLRLDVLDMTREQVLHDIELAHAAGATHFNIPLLLCQKNKTATEVFWCADYFSNQRHDLEALPQDYKDRIRVLSLDLKARGFTLGFLPMILAREDGAWRGFFEPSDFNAWGQSYLKRLDEMADLAGLCGVIDFIVGTELVHLYVATNPDEQPARTRYWRSVYSILKNKLGAGVSVILVANWDQFDKIPFWDASDVIGLSAYYPLSESDGVDSPGNTVAKLTARWRIWRDRLLSLARRNHKRLYFSEVGYPSHVGGAREPWNFSGTVLDLELQRRSLEAFANTWGADREGREGLARFVIWALDVPEDPLHDTGYGIFGKPSEQTLSNIFRLRLAKRGR